MTASPITGAKFLGMGGIGTGKTTLIKSLVSAGITPMCILLEPGSPSRLGDIPADKLHWMYLPPVTDNIQNLLEASKRIGTLNADAIQKTNDMTRDSRNQFYPMLKAMADFKCDRTGESFGNVGAWGTDKCLVTDSLSGITLAATKNAVGEKYAMTQPEFQIAMKLIENFINFLTTSLWCHVYVIAHIEREIDEVNGGAKKYPSTLGRKLAPVLGRNFTDVFMTKRLAGNPPKYVIDTLDPEADLKGPHMGNGSELPMSLAPAIENWKRQGGIISSELPQAVTP